MIVVNGAFEATPERADRRAQGRRPAGRPQRPRAAPSESSCSKSSGGGISERALFDAAGDVLPGFARARRLRVLGVGAARQVSQLCDMAENREARGAVAAQVMAVGVNSQFKIKCG